MGNLSSARTSRRTFVRRAEGETGEETCFFELLHPSLRSGNQRTFVLFHPSLRSGKRIQLSPDDYLAKIVLVMVWGSRVAVFLFFFLFPFFIQAADSVVINEIAWTGTTNSANDEWIELYNNTGNSINLDGWQLVAQDGTPKIKLSGVIPANGFYLLERTDDNTVPAISADKIYTGALGNNGENLELYDASGNLIDSANCASGWFAGDNKTKQTMERKNFQLVGSDPNNWQTSQNPGGTPKGKNSLIGQTELQPKTKPDETAVDVKHQQLVQQPITHPSGIVINEILPSPEGPDDLEEWIEISNQNQFEVDLSGWKIKDSAGAVTTFTVPAGTKISALGFLVINRPTTKIVLNNDGDEISLIQPDNKIIETISYSKAPLGQSYGRFDSEWFWTPQSTPGTDNVIPQKVSENKKTEPSESASKENEDFLHKKELAAIGKQVTKNNYFVFLIALAIAIFSAIIILILKRKVKGSRST